MATKAQWPDEKAFLPLPPTQHIEYLPATEAFQMPYGPEKEHADSQVAERLTTTAMPTLGSSFLGFELLEELGRGVFGRVFLAQQGELAGRLVALKVSTRLPGESQTLAQLQHTNIVPIYSVHHAPPFHALCMPYFGSVTLADLLRQLRVRDSLPVSGNHIVSTLNGRKRSTVPGPDSRSGEPSRTGSSAARLAAPTEEPDATPAARTGHTTQLLDKLDRFSYVNAILWIGSRLADGLAHAHERGIYHHDLKPANVLLTDEGQPMLLDFNLSRDSKLQQMMACPGGTVAYMAPEHMEAYQGATQIVDGRSDLYSLGLILFELLTGKQAVPVPPGPVEKIAPDLLAKRRAGAPRLRVYSSAVSPAAEAIVRKCLEPDPSRRYQSASELREELERHLDDLPLAHTTEPSLRERLGKWMRRHPRLRSITSIASAAAILLTALAGTLITHKQRLKRFEAVDTLNRFEQEIKTAQFLLYDRNADSRQLDDGIARCREALGRYALPDDRRWRDLPAVRHLPAQERERLGSNLGEALFVMARAMQLQATALTEPGPREKQTRFALRLSELAEECYGAHRAPRALWEQHAELLRLVGKSEESDTLLAKARATPLREDRDYYLLGHKHAMEGNFRKALPLLEQATRHDPQNFAAWFVRGNCHYELLQDAQAVGCFHCCIALRPDFPWAWFNRGLAHARMRNDVEARADFDRVLELQPGLARAHVSRAEVAHAMKDYKAAVGDFTSALKEDSRRASLYFLRARSREALGDRQGAELDRVAGMRQTPADPESWVERGLAHVQSDPKQALADFESALKLNPRFFKALQNKAAVLSDKFKRDDEALRVLDRTVELFPDSVLALGGRGVLLARIGKRAAAHKDAEAALLLDTQPQTLYQVACIYALTARKEPQDKLRAFQLLAGALRHGFGLDWIDDDSDLDLMRKEPEYQRIVRAARALHARPKRS
jgi:serine/threonine protein kinase/Tfp pilus assembly protein PilF